MGYKYLIKLYVFTLLIGPVLFGMYAAFQSGFGQLLSSLAFFPVQYLFSVLFSLPVLIVCLLATYLMQKYKLDLFTQKLVIILIALIGIILVLLWLGGSLTYPFVGSYSVAIVLAAVGMEVW
ncbi:MAG: hypothetical protein AAF741_08475 [Bacteroidota bacterium]